MLIAASKASPFKAGKTLREAVNMGWEPAVTNLADDRNLSQHAHEGFGAAVDVSDWPGEIEPE